MMRNLKPEINISLVYKKFIVRNRESSQNNKTLAELLYNIFNYYNDNYDFRVKYFEK